MKLNISDPKTAKTYSIEIKDKDELYFLDKKIKDKVNLSFIKGDLEAIITGGSDKDGFPMSPSLDLVGRKKTFLSKSVGFRPTRKGERRRKRVAGRIIGQNIQQINLKIISGDTKPIEEKYGKKSKENTKEETKEKK